MSRLPSLLVTGTDTGVGKTVATALLIMACRNREVAAAPFKPVAAGAKRRRGRETWADVSFLAAAAGVPEEDISLYRLKKPLSPHLAAAADGTRINIKAIARKFNSLKKKYGAVLVEGAGGIMAPISARKTFLDLATELDLPVLVVTTPRLGTLNHTLLTVSACRKRGLQVAGLIINHCPAKPAAAEKSNLAELERLTKIPVIGLIPEISVSVEKLEFGGLAAQAGHLDLSRLQVKRRGSVRALAADRRHVWHPFSAMLEYQSEKPHPLMIVSGKGSYLKDSEGRRYLDGTASLWVNVHGHRRPELDRAVRAQLGRVAHSTLLGLGNEPAALLAAQLAELAPPGLERVFFSDNGSTAVEVALKVAFQYWRQSGQPQKKEFVSFVGAYHGDTIGAVSVGGHDLYHATFKPLLFKAHLAPAAYCYRCPAGLSFPGCKLACLDGVANLLARRSGRVAAVIVEPRVQGAAGILVQPPGYLERIARLCRRHGALLVADEVATGFGRTGTMFACQQEGVRPDIMALAKGVTGGYLPLAATLFKEEIYAAFLGRYEELKTFFHGHTYTGNPLAAAAALANIALVKKPGFLPGINRRSARLAALLKPLEHLPHVGDVRQLGLMAGIELVQDRDSRTPFPARQRVARRVILKARERGVIIRPLDDTVALMPPLPISYGELKRLAGAAAWAIREVTERGNG